MRAGAHVLFAHIIKRCYSQSIPPSFSEASGADLLI
jgi:hypothetical protein